MTLTSLLNPDVDQLLLFICGWTFCNLHATTTLPRLHRRWTRAKNRFTAPMDNFQKFTKTFKCTNGTAVSLKTRRLVLPLGMCHENKEDIDVSFHFNKVVHDAHGALKRSMYILKTDEINHRQMIAVTAGKLPDKDMDQLLFLMFLDVLKH